MNCHVSLFFYWKRFVMCYTKLPFAGYPCQFPLYIGMEPCFRIIENVDNEKPFLVCSNSGMNHVVCDCCKPHNFTKNIFLVVIHRAHFRIFSQQTWFHFTNVFMYNGNIFVFGISALEISMNVLPLTLSLLLLLNSFI